MTDRNAIMEQILARLRSIRTLKEFKAAREEMIDLISKIMTSAIDLLKAFLENMSSMSPDDQAAGAARFQDENFLISAEVMQEIERLNNLPGAGKYAESFSLELEKIMKPHMEEFEQQMGRLMENLMGGMLGGLTDAMGAAFDSIGAEPEESYESEFVYDEDNPDMLYFLYALGLYSMKSLSDLEAGKDSLVENLEMEIDMHRSNLEMYFMPGTEVAWEDDKRRISEIQRLIDRLFPELETQLTRISNVSDSGTAVGKIKDEIISRLEPGITALKEQLTLKKAEWKKKGL